MYVAFEYPEHSPAEPATAPREDWVGLGAMVGYAVASAVLLEALRRL
jgi:hypothetical protein